MSQVSLIDKLQILFKITKSNIFYPITILVLLVVSFLFMTTNQNNKKESKKTYGTIYAIIIIVTLIKYANSFSTMFDYMMDNLFIIFYFPNIAVYLCAIIITNIIMWISMFSTNTKKTTKVVNSLVFAIIHYIFILTLGIITTKKLDVFNQMELYQNEEIHALIELTSNVFIVWIIFLVIYKILISYLESRKNKKILKSVSMSVEHIKPEENISTFKLPDDIIKIDHPYIVKRDTTKTKIVYNLPQQTENTAIYEQMLTLEDYKLLISLLKEQKTSDVKRILNNQNKEVLEKNKFIKNELKDTPKNKSAKPENSMTELMALYKAVS